MQVVSTAYMKIFSVLFIGPEMDMDKQTKVSKLYSNKAVLFGEAFLNSKTRDSFLILKNK
jgi:hypothetical protein